MNESNRGRLIVLREAAARGAHGVETVTEPFARRQRAAGAEAARLESLAVLVLASSTLGSRAAALSSPPAAARHWRASERRQLGRPSVQGLSLLGQRDRPVVDARDALPDAVIWPSKSSMTSESTPAS